MVTRAVEDEDLVAGAVRGEIGAARQIWERYAPLVKRVLRVVLHSSSESPDLAQEVFLHLFQQLDRLRQAEALRPFLLGICVRVARNHIRRKRVRAIVALTPDVDWIPALPGAGPDTQDAVRRLTCLLDSLSERDRSLFVNRYVERMEVGEIATLHQMSFSTTRRRIDRMTKLVSARAKRDDVLGAYFARWPRGLHPTRRSAWPFA